jgi:hypothetical protein
MEAMLKRHVFTAPDGAGAVQARLQAAAADGIVVEVSGAEVKIGRRHALPLLNGFSPVFVGRVEDRGAGAEIAGRFRFHLAAIGVIAGFVALSAWQLLQLLAMGEAPPGYPEGWRGDRIRFELQFLAFSAAALYVAWLAGRPMRERILDLIRRSVQPPAARRGR